MKKIILFTLMLFGAMSVQSKSFKIGPASSSDNMDFTTINAAMSSSSVTHGDTLYLSQNYYEKLEQYVTKSVVIIGTGYDATLTDEGVVAYVNELYLKADGIYVKSLKTNYIYLYNADCTIDRCYACYIYPQTTISGKNNIYSSYIIGQIGNGSYTCSFNIYNNVINSGYSTPLYYLTNSDIQYNTIINSYSSSGYTLYGVNNSTIKNNIILHTNSSYYGYVFYTTSGCTIEHNILSWTSSNSSFPTNKTGYGGQTSSLFVCEGSYSDYYRLKSGSAGIGYATDGGEVGCHGGMFGNPAGGRPQFYPYFTKVTVGSKTTDGKLPVSLSVKIQDK